MESVVRQYEAEVEETEPPFIDKAKRSLNSRKFWLTVLIISIATVLFGYGQITANVYVVVVTIAIGIYTGTLGFEDGMRKIAPLLLPALKPLLDDEKE